MLLDDMVGVIELLKERITTHGANLRENETRTRMALIDPLLQALGWDVSDPAMVTPEYSVGASRADYALLTPTGNPSALIEAKKLDESLASHRMQMLNYANISGIPHAGLTDGNHWEMYTVFDQAPIEQRRILDVSIANTPAHEATLKLLLLWRPNLASARPVAANAPVVAQSNEQIVEDAPIVITPVNSHAIPAIEQHSLGGWNSLSNVNGGKGNKSPTAIRFFGGEERAVGNWRSVLVEATEWLVRNERLTAADCPIDTGRGWLFINSVPHKPNGRDFFSPRQISGGIYLETNLSASDSIRFSKQLLSRFGINPETVELRFE